MEFCPILSDEEVSTLSSAQLISYFGKHRNVSRWEAVLNFGTPALVFFAFSVTLYQTNDQQLYARYGVAAAASTASVNSTTSPSVATKLRILDIVDPATGAKISPILRNASPATGAGSAYNSGRAW